MGSYSNFLPRQTQDPDHRCQYLNSDGSRCRRKSEYEVSIHPDGEIYDTLFWVVSELCEEHGKEHAPKKEVKNIGDKTKPASFKVGDKVRIKESRDDGGIPNYHQYVGMKTEIEFIDDDNPEELIFNLKNTDGWWFGENQFDLIEKKKSKLKPKRDRQVRKHRKN